MNALGIIFSNIHDFNVPELTGNRTMAAIPFGGRYRLIDFPLSCMVNSGITHIGCVTKRNYRSLMDHIGSGKEWDLARLNGGFVLLPPFGEVESDLLYNSRLEALKTILGFIKRSNEEYFIMSDANSVYNIDFKDLVAYHEKNNAEITLLFVKKKYTEIGGKDNLIIKYDDENRVTDILRDPRMQGVMNLYGDVMVMKRTLLISIVNEAISQGYRHFSDVLIASLKKYRIMAYEHKGYFEQISSLKRYYEVNLELLQKEKRDALFGGGQIFTRVKNSAPTKYGANAIVKNSVISDGCVIEGEVYNSVLARGVKVGRGTVIRDSVIMKNMITGENVTINCVVTDKNVVVRDRKTISGTDSFPIYIPKDSIV